MHKKNARYRTKEVLAADIVTVLSLPLSYGTKYAVVDDALWKWSEFHGKYDGCFCWSAEALKVAEQTKELRHEHLIPRGVLIAMLMKNPPTSAEALLSWLNSRCVGVVVTKAEDAKLNKAGLRSKMPADWDGKDIWARYRAAGIRLAAGLGGDGRAESVALARGLLGDRRLMAFLRWTRDARGPLACKLINQEFEDGETLDATLGKPGEYGYTLEVEDQGEGRWRISFGCQAGSLAGDGGEWEVKFDGDGEVTEGWQPSFWIS